MDQADRSPAAALLEGEELLDLLDETAEVHEPGLGIAVHAIRQVSDEVLEIACDAADGGVARRELLAQAVQPIGEASRYGLNSLLFRLLPEPLVLHEHVVDGIEERLLLPGRQMYAIAHP